MAGAIGIVGLGLIGGSLALSLRRARPELRIVGVDRDGSTRAQALAAGAVDVASAPDDADFAGCDALVLAVPAQDLIDMLLGVAARMRARTVLTDVCGAKEAICARAAAQDRVVFVGAHPMAGTEFRGFGAAREGLFAGATVAVCPPVGLRDEAARAAAAKQVRDLWLAVGAAKLLDIAPDEHDRAVTYASHLPYLAAAAVVDVLFRAQDSVTLARELAAGGFRDTTRLAGDGTVGGAAALNRFVPGAARELSERLRALAAALESDPSSALSLLGKLADERRRMRLPGSTPAAPAPRVESRRSKVES